MRLLAEAGIDILCKSKDEGLNALHLACRYKYENIVEMLVKSLFPLNLQTTEGDTAIAIAA